MENWCCCNAIVGYRYTILHIPRQFTAQLSWHAKSVNQWGRFVTCIPLLNMNIERNFEATLWRHRWRHHHKNFFGIIWDNLFISEVRLKLSLIFQNFQNGRHLELATNFFAESYTGSWIYQKDSHEHFWHFERLIEALTQILTYQFKNLTYFVTWWRHQWRHEYISI